MRKFEFFEELDHIGFLRRRLVIGASEWLAGNHGSKENDKEKLGYTDKEWQLIWSLMMEDGAWALPSLKDEYGNFVKDNHAPELLIKFAAHDFQCHIIVFDLQLNRIQFCSGNHLKNNNVIFDSPLILYATGSHFQSVFQKDHTFFINLSNKLELDNSNFHGQLEVGSESQFNENRTKAMDRKVSNKLKHVEIDSKSVVEKYPNNKSWDDLESRFEFIKQTKRRERSIELQREYETLMKKRKRHLSSSKTKKLEAEKNKTRNARTRENETKKKMENENEKLRKSKVRENETKKKMEKEKEKLRKAKVRENEMRKQEENEKEKRRKARAREDETKKMKENELLKAARLTRTERQRSKFIQIAVNVNQDEFREKELSSELLSSSVGSIWEKENQCKLCGAFRFKDETNFCCGKGKVNKVSALPEPPKELKTLFENQTFLRNARGYNNILAMASVGCHTPDQFKGPNFKIQGKIHHKIGSLIPDEQNPPKFLQLYFYDTDEATKHRLDVMPKLSSPILKQLTDIIKDTNCYVKSFKAAHEMVESGEELKIVLISDKMKVPPGQHKGKYSLPQGCEVAALMPGEGDGELEVIVRNRDNKLTRISTLHRCYDPLSYVLIDPYGTDGFHTAVGKKEGTKRNISIAEFYSFRIQVRPGFSLLLRSRRCFQQYLVDQGAKIENARMKWVMDNQKTIKAEKYNGLIDASATGDRAKVGTKIILPPTITGSPRFYVAKFQDTMAIVRKFGKPTTIFITMTLNPDWQEIKDALNLGETAFDRPDITTRVFKLKNDMLIKDIEKNQIFGKVIAYVGTQEQQKRKGLHHTHTLITLESVPRNPEDIDKIVSAEIPDPSLNPELHAIIVKNNIHGPCGNLNPGSPCMETDDKGRKFCTKEFPKDFQDETSLTEFTYPKYRRRGPTNGGRTTTKLVKGKPVVVDNSCVVPYNSYLSRKYNAHINIEFVGSVVAVKYIYKYITKGPDRCMMSTKPEGTKNMEPEQINEVEQFVDARYLGASESVLKILRFSVHYRSHGVDKLPCHLPGEQSVFFNEGEEEKVLQAGPPQTKLTEFFKTNLLDESAKEFLYIDPWSICLEVW